MRTPCRALQVSVGRLRDGDDLGQLGCRSGRLHRVLGDSEHRSGGDLVAVLRTQGGVAVQLLDGQRVLCCWRVIGAGGVDGEIDRVDEPDGDGQGHDARGGQDGEQAVPPPPVGSGRRGPTRRLGHQMQPLPRMPFTMPGRTR